MAQAIVKAEGQGLLPRKPASRELTRYCQALISNPTAKSVVDAQQFLARTLDRSGGYAASALSPFENFANRCENLRDGQTVMGDALVLIDACSRLPMGFLRGPSLWGEGITLRELLCASMRLVRVLVATLDRAATELGLEPFDGGPFALPGGAR